MKEEEESEIRKKSREMEMGKELLERKWKEKRGKQKSGIKMKENGGGGQ